MKNKLISKIGITVLICSIMCINNGCKVKQNTDKENHDNAISTVRQLKKQSLTGTNNNTSLTIQEIFNYAIKNEDMKKNTYKFIIDKFKAESPFKDIYMGKNINISLLKATSDKYNIPISNNKLGKKRKDIRSITEAVKVMKEHEINDIAMYNKFLNQKQVPQELILTFKRLKDNCIYHLNLLDRV